MQHPSMRDIVIQRLENAGRTLMMLPMPRGGYPAGHRSNMPEPLREYWDLFGVANAEDETEEEAQARRKAQEDDRNRVRLIANHKQIVAMDEALEWLWYIEKPHHRRTVFARMLVWPDNERHVFSWGRLSRHLGHPRDTIRVWHERGIEQIIRKTAALEVI